MGDIMLTEDLKTPLPAPDWKNYSLSVYNILVLERLIDTRGATRDPWMRIFPFDPVLQRSGARLSGTSGSLDMLFTI